MPNWYRCHIEGRHFPGSLLQLDGDIGFYTSRIVEAESAEQAEGLAVSLLRNAESLQLPADQPAPLSARVFVTEVQAIEEPESPIVQPGLAFFPEEGGGVGNA